MAFKNGAYAKIQEILENKENYKDVRITTSKKNRTTGKYEYDFSSRVRLLGESNKINIEQGDVIKVIDCEISNKYDKEKKITYWNPVIWSFEKLENTQKETKNNNVKPSNETKKEENNEEEEEEILPF